MVTKKQIVDTARTYVGTPYLHQGRLKGMAMDCVGLPLMVAQELGLKDTLGVPFLGSDNANYSSQPLDQAVQDEAIRRMVRKPVEALTDGDVITLRVPTIPCHVAIVSTVNGTLGMIHAYAPSGKVVEHIMDAKWKKRISAAFTFPGVE
jgi:NlpC/P60 family putative phage cell wall peptidase